MDIGRTTRLYIIVAAAALAVVSIASARPQPAPAGGQETSPAGVQGQPPAGTGQRPAPKNLKVLTGLEGPQVLKTMQGFNAGLGVECNFCHHPPFEADTPRKDVARLMIRDYTMGLKHKDGAELTCNDCHKGQPNFLRTRPFENVMGKASTGLQVLKGLPEERLTQIMTAFTKALGVDCAYCHKGDDFDTDTPRKQIARFMMTEFSQALVKKDGSPVSCSDCHQGHARPLAVLSFPHREGARPTPGAGEPPKKPGI
jgi:nitrate/TMAO reductase-like tetraheme cytochrome c subunit